jgi:hypothetical protein
VDHHRALRILALDGVLRDRDGDPDRPPSVEFQRRKIFMWYSTTFATPLHMVQELPIEDVMEAYYHWHYAEMSEDDLEAEVKEITGATSAAAAANLDEMGTWEMEREVEDEDTIEEAFARAKGKAKPAARAEDIKGAALKSGPTVKKAEPKPEKRGAEIDLPDAVGNLAQKLEMTFVTLEELERLESEDGLGSIEPLTGLDKP